MTRRRSLARSVFVNCPFDPDYRDKFNALIFTIHFCGFHVRCALETADSDTDKFQYRISCSDLAGVDIEAHNDDPLELIRVICHWLDKNRLGKKPLPGPKYVIQRYQEFLSDLPALCKPFHIDPEEIQFDRYVSLIEGWIREHELEV